MMLELEGRPVMAVIFDFDGVLADTAAGWSRAEAALCEYFGVRYSDAMAEATDGVSLSDSVRVLTAGVRPPVAHEEAVHRLRALAQRYVPESLTAVEGGVAAVRALSRLLPVAIASNSERPLLEHMVHELGLADHVTTVVSATDVAAPKPAPDVYRGAARRVGAVPQRALVVEGLPHRGCRRRGGRLRRGRPRTRGRPVAQAGLFASLGGGDGSQPRRVARPVAAIRHRNLRRSTSPNAVAP